MNPFYFPRLRFHGFDSLRSLSLLAVDSATILEDAAEILSCSMIDHLVVTAGNHTLGQSPMPLFSKIPKTKPLRLKSFDIQGYDVLSLPDMWERVVASELHEITVKLPEDSGVMSFDESNVFWSGMLHEASRVSYLCTDMVCSALLKLIGTSKVDVIGIKHLILIPAGDILDEKYDLVNNFLEQTLHRVSENLVTLALYARNGDTSKIACSKSDLRKILIECKKLNEVGIVLANNDLVGANTAGAWRNC